MRVRVTLAIDVDPDTLRRETDIAGPNVTAGEIRDATRRLAAIEVQQGLGSTKPRASGPDSPMNTLKGHSTRRYTQSHGQMSKASVR